MRQYNSRYRVIRKRGRLYLQERVPFLVFWSIWFTLTDCISMTNAMEYIEDRMKEEAAREPDGVVKMFDSHGNDAWD